MRPRTLLPVYCLMLVLTGSSAADSLQRAVSTFAGTGGSTSSSSGSSSLTGAQCAEPAAVEEPVFKGVRIPALPAGQKPNFIVILTDDQGWDDIGLHNPQYVNTPNIDAFIRGGTLFDNYYVSPQCAQTRAMVLTGRTHPKTGTMLVHGGYDYLNRGEVTAGKVMADAGYATGHFGKWHNGDSLGYEPWHVGFQESWRPQDIFPDSLMTHNGQYVQTKGQMEFVLLDKLLQFLNTTAAAGSRQPFFVFYAPRLMHVASGRRRPVPAEFWRRYVTEARYQGIPQATLRAWAMTEYLDAVLGRLFAYLRSTGLDQSTYVFLSSDNGADPLSEKRQVRMPSNMQGNKNKANEGGIRTFLAVNGPGVAAGVIDSTLLQAPDLLPTVADLAGLKRADKATRLNPTGALNPTQSPQTLTPGPANVNVNPAAQTPEWDGLSFAHLLVPAEGAPAQSEGGSGYRGDVLATAQQRERHVFALSAHCWSSDAVAKLNRNRDVIRPQALMNIDKGGMPNLVIGPWLDLKPHPGFWPCLAVRYKDFKYNGRDGKLYRFTGRSHVELPCNEVAGTLGTELRANITAAARAWWASITASPNSFSKPSLYVGLGDLKRPGIDDAVSNLVAVAAHERTAGRVKVLPAGVSGFSSIGDRICIKIHVLTSGLYDASIFYTSKQAATFGLYIGAFADIMAGRAQGITATLQAQDKLSGVRFGSAPFNLTASSSNKIEACLVLLNSTNVGRPVFTLLGNIRMVRQTNNSRLVMPAVKSDSDSSADAGNVLLQSDWDVLRKRYKLPSGQYGSTSLWSPYSSEGIERCAMCQPEIN